LAPWADVLYSCDAIWWQKNAVGPDFTFEGLKISQDKKVKREFPDVHVVEVVRGADKLLIDKPGVIGWGGNSGFHALNLAVQFGAAKIILVGYDMTLKHGLHWHGKHPQGMHNPSDGNVARWRRVVDEAANYLKALDVTVINTSPISALVNYPKMSLQEALDYGSDHHSTSQVSEERIQLRSRRKASATAAEGESNRLQENV
jgi:hypothetical protein